MTYATTPETVHSFRTSVRYGISVTQAPRLRLQCLPSSSQNSTLEPIVLEADYCYSASQNSNETMDRARCAGVKTAARSRSMLLYDIQYARRPEPDSCS
jgi:hypothetical protein